MHLFINATQNQGIVLKLIDGQNVLNTKIVPGDNKIAEKLLVVFDDYLREHELVASDLNGIIVVSGPGSFTNVRIVCTMANTLSQLTGVPIFGDNMANLDTDQKVIEATHKVKQKALIIPFYDREPNITI